MGQRHQIFVKVLNPVNILAKHDVTEKMKTAFGTDKYTVLAFHNQWLYGRSALRHCLNLLTHAFQLDKKEKDSKSGFGAYGSPLTYNGINSKFADPEKWVDAIAFIMNYLAEKTEFNDAGFLGSFYLGFDEPVMREDFTMGDNNDGITIIDVVENKYCFMNISTYKRESGDLAYSASDLPYLKPVSAHDYVRAYYGESVKTVNPYHIKDKDKTPKQIVLDLKNGNMKLVRQFAKFGVLTESEVIAIFPKLEKEISGESLVVLE